MMDIKILMYTARCVTLELIEGGIYDTDKIYDIWINDKFYGKTDKIVTNIYGLKPSTEYLVRFVYEGEEKGSIWFQTKRESVTLNVKTFGAHGDGKDDETAYLQAAIYACPREGRVLVPAGIYHISPLFLKSGISLEIEKNAILIGPDKKEAYPVLPGISENYEETQEYNLGTWEGNPLDMYAGLLTAIDASDIYIYGEGIVDGNAKSCGWWEDTKNRVKTHRPRLIYLCRCENVRILGLTFQNSPSWTIHPYFCRRVGFYANQLFNPCDSPNTDGINPESSQKVDIEGVHFSLGDDCVAIKSGKIYMGQKYKTPSKKIKIRHCLMENGHGAVTIGSEMAAGIERLTVRDCIFRRTDRGLRIKTRRGRGKDAVVDDIRFLHIKMEEVKVPFVVNSFYFCDPDGHTNYVQTREVLPVDERTPQVKGISISDIECHECHIAAAYIEGLPEQKIEHLELRNIKVDFAKDALPGIAAMTEGVKEEVKQGFFIHNVKNLRIKNVHITGQQGEAFNLEGVEEDERE